MVRIDSAITVSWDKDSNTASLEFGRSDRPRWTVPVTDEGTLVATLRFSEEGEILELELLDAAKQLPRAMRGE